MNFTEKNRGKIKDLATRTIGEEGIEQATTLVLMLQSKDANVRAEAVALLQSLLSNKQKRPLYYLHIEIKNECDNTRAVVWFASMYIEWLTKFMRREFALKKFPLGMLIRALGKDIPEDFRDELSRYNAVFWVNAKHIVQGYPDDEHLFSLEDAVVCCLITANLANRIMAISQRARDYSEGKILI